VAVFGGHHSPRKGRTYFSRKISIAAAEISLGLRETVTVGWLDGLRDWGWAPDFAGALPRLAALAPDDYVVSTGQPHSPREWVQAVFESVDLDCLDHVLVDETLGNRIERNQTAPPDSRLAGLWQPRLAFENLAFWMTRADLTELKESRDDAAADAAAVADWRARRAEGEEPEPWNPEEYDT
jgi:GDPmannose 4,6-dehydratase